VTWLLAQIGLVVLLAALSGWFVGWHLRAFRDQDRVEDLHQTMLVTKDVADRELSELRRKTEDLEGRLLRENDSSARSVAVVASLSTAPATIPGVADRAQESDAPPAMAPLVEVTASTAPPNAETSAAVIGEPAELTGVAAAERERRREAEAALRKKAAAMLTLQSEIEALHEAVAEKAAKIAELQDSVVESEPASRELEAKHEEVVQLEARVQALDAERVAAVADAAAREAELLESRKETVIRDTRINDLRNRCATLETELAHAREAASEPGEQDLGRLEDGLDDARRALQRQIDRNRKQEAVHRAVVEQLEGDKARLRDAIPAPTVPHVTDGPPAGARRGLPQKRSDELTQIVGVGPGFAKAMREAGIDTYAQVAAWTDHDIERYAAALGAHVKRIRTDRWVEQAGELARTSRARRD